MTFETTAGQQVPAVTADEMREVDRVAVEEFDLQLLQMMENAGRNLAGRVRAVLGTDASGTGVTVVAGQGGNGGGGLACARHLANRDVAVSVVLDRPPAALTGAATQQHGILAEMGIPVAHGPEPVEAGNSADTGVVVDALIGYGLSGAVRGPAADLVRAVNAADAPVVSLDVPSGRNATTGEEPGEAVAPTEVLTLALPKTGLAGGDWRLVLADIAVPAGVYARIGIDYQNPFDAYRIALEETDDEPR